MRTTRCPHCRSAKYERAEEQASVVAPCDRCGPIFEAGVTAERARIRSWLGQQAARTKRGPSASLTNHAIGKGDAFKEAADYLKPPRKPSAKLVEKRAKRKAVAK